MKLEKGEISSSQLVFLVGGFLQGSLLTLSFAGNITKHDTWLAVIAGVALTVPLALVYIALAQRFPGKNLVEMNELIYGPYLGKLISLQYIGLFLTILASNLWFIGDFFLTYILPETPILVIMIMFMFICAWAVRNGIEVIARTSFLFVLITLLITSITFILLLKNMKITNLLPVLDIPLRDFIHSTNILMAIPFNEVFVFLMVIPYMNNQKHIKATTLLGLTIGGLNMLLMTIRNTLVLGPLVAILTSSSMESVRLINIGKILTRLEMVVAISLLVSLFLKVSVFYYATVLGIAQLVKMRSYLPLVLPVGIIGITLALCFESSMQFIYTSQNTFPIFSIPFYILIPILSLFIAKIRKLPK
ncbi:endospore germination permease [Desulfosporosinus sp. Sb-LF]|uniref:GerAB/ArcD/ProY family transporter n=1 Tax=Desulfosporosinus sp. Sb-LF TaxID=2560027 RepID=UPI00107F61D2|nr:endospore germination permease [Desulfosporosinus sp. Sb-LF]TGE34603.1 spore gernimation protein [Desulfosporosinus sp. Sb-LF]